ncbi:putative two-component system response regulator [Desulfomicrobium macestii]|uniref:Two-component system response regulator n=2 Tax=Desulfomicrobium TaxID=898 RepID=A0ABR9H174_9BACT|nr:MULTISPECIES: HD domain-containing phosphohydrolase [Desulfomicrobium]MBE1424451.1 putative two-component system response regulator [Desulfomicrobium macestii]SFL86550.1 putative two-component system response regulator [Desulfomicrobium norvegicum]
MTSRVEKPVILIVDDTESNIDLLVGVLGDEYELSVAMSGLEALEAVRDARPDLILLDIMMPGMDGYEVCRKLKSEQSWARIPVIFITAMTEVEDEARGFDVGAIDYIAKPFSPPIVQARVKTHLALADQQRTCEKTVETQVAAIRQGQKDAIYMMGQAGHYNDDNTGVHIWRMAAYARALAKAAGWTVEEQEQMLLAAPMHDSGKIGTPDAILKKPGKLTDEEWVIMREHTTVGHKILSVSDAPVFRMAAEIALSHHERWLGGGYPQNIKGEDIPESARISAIADVFDALTMERPYKEAWSVDKAMEYIRDNAGHFEPRLTNLFISIRDEIERIRDYWNQHEKEDLFTASLDELGS